MWGRSRMLGLVGLAVAILVVFLIYQTGDQSQARTKFLPSYNDKYLPKPNSGAKTVNIINTKQISQGDNTESRDPVPDSPAQEPAQQIALPDDEPTLTYDDYGMDQQKDTKKKKRGKHKKGQIISLQLDELTTVEEDTKKEEEERKEEERKKEERRKSQAENSERKSELKRMRAEKQRLIREDERLEKEKEQQEKTRQDLEKLRMELQAQKNWLHDEMKRLEEQRRIHLESRRKLESISPQDLLKLDAKNITQKLLNSKDPESIFSDREEDKKLWTGLNPLAVERKYQGIMLDGDYILRPFVDPDDKRAQGMEGHPRTLEDMTDGQAEDRFYQLATTTHVHCANKLRMGNFGDGGWDVCTSGPYYPQQNCIVYSFGINNDFSFDEAISSDYGCQVRAFDPSMDMGDHLHSPNVFFYQVGLGPVNEVNTRGWKLQSLETILDRFGHLNKVIDFLKMDIEYNEWSSFREILKHNTLKNVKQLAFEIHTSEVYLIGRPSNKKNFSDWYDILLSLEKQGFRKYHFHFNPYGRYASLRTGKERTCCYELYYINLNFLK